MVLTLITTTGVLLMLALQQKAKGEHRKTKIEVKNV
jgi:hypothetical protein